MLNEDDLGHICIEEGAREDVWFELLSEKTLYALIYELLKELIEEEEGLPDIDAQLYAALNQRLLLPLEDLVHFILGCPISVHLLRTLPPLKVQFVDQVCDQELQLCLHRLLS